jgi:hypothetical protein
MRTAHRRVHLLEELKQKEKKNEKKNEKEKEGQAVSRVRGASSASQAKEATLP